jgi:hypothetical protein
VQDPPEVHEVAGVVRLPVEGAVLDHVVHVTVEDGIFHQLTNQNNNLKNILNGIFHQLNFFLMYLTAFFINITIIIIKGISHHQKFCFR